MVANYEQYGYFADEELVASGAAQEEDTLSGGQSSKFAKVIFFNGLKNPLAVQSGMDAKGRPTYERDDDKNADGFCIMLQNAPSNLITAAKVVADMKDENGQPAGELIYVAHESKRSDDGSGYVYKLYLRIFKPRWHILTHAVNSPASMMRFDDREKVWKAFEANCSGFVGVVRTDYNSEAKPPQQKTANSYSVLAIERHLWDAGYTDPTTDLPIPVVLNFKSMSSKAFYKDVLLPHFEFVKKHREWYAQQLVANGEVQNPKIAAVRAQRFVTFSSVAIDLRRSLKKSDHKGHNGVQRCYDPENHSVELYKNHQLANKHLWCGVDPYLQAIFPWLYNVTNRPATPDGPAVEWAREELAQALKNQLEYNPQNALEFGTHDAPLWMINRFAKQKAGVNDPDDYDDEAPTTPTTRSNGAGSQNAKSIKMLSDLLERHYAIFSEYGTDDDRGIWENAKLMIEGEDEASTLEILKDAKNQSVKRYREVCTANGLPTGF